MKKMPGLAHLKNLILSLVHLSWRSNLERETFDMKRKQRMDQSDAIKRKEEVGYDSDDLVFFKNGSNPSSFCSFLFFSHDKCCTNLTINDESLDGVLGSRTHGGRMVGTDKSPGLW